MTKSTLALEKIVISQIMPELIEIEPSFSEVIVPPMVHILSAPYELEKKFQNTSYTFMEGELEYEAVKIMSKRLKMIFDDFNIKPDEKLAVVIMVIWINSMKELARTSSNWSVIYSIADKLIADL